jgi:Rrf2 family protein
MLTLSRKTHYALIALAYVAEHANQLSSARAIAAASGLSQPLMMNILKHMQQHGLVESERGSKGGYRLASALDLDEVTLYDLVQMHASEQLAAVSRRTRPPLEHAPALALHYKLMRFLKDVRLSDLVLPGRRIDVPVESMFKNLTPAGVS